MTYDEAKRKAIDWAKADGGPEFSEGKIAKGIENEDTFAFIEKVPRGKTGKGKFDFLYISPRVFTVDKETGKVMFYVYSDHDVLKYIKGKVIEDNTI